MGLRIKPSQHHPDHEAAKPGAHDSGTTPVCDKAGSRTSGSGPAPNCRGTQLDPAAPDVRGAAGLAALAFGLSFGAVLQRHHRCGSIAGSGLQFGDTAGEVEGDALGADPQNEAALLDPSDLRLVLGQELGAIRTGGGLLYGNDFVFRHDRALALVARKSQSLFQLGPLLAQTAEFRTLVVGDGK